MHIDITKIDANFLAGSNIDKTDIVWKNILESPIVMASMPNEDLHPTYRAERRDVIEETYRRAKNEGDDKVWFVDGLALFGDEDRDACTMDGLHPNDLGFYMMAKNLLPHIREALKIYE